ncbi:phage head protein [Burkholderia sp. MSMB2042]|nr:phage head protein [Burkholderia savannae]KVG45941.1 phage head protein [Burkholderia sp. MSMB0265]KVG83524.1 phage head protein [Burkholderia sp. MSMB2040]KVG91883.1 phage head protein [Burkholderia sp. MSMB2041]KVG93214.1 phage head protein [Burkholderia sp. MSMB2042]KVK85493.1 phage head protein [Burkholderia sp. MSMB1498]
MMRSCCSLLISLRGARRFGPAVRDAIFGFRSDSLRHAARDAMLTVNDELAAWRARQRAAGAATLADVPAPHIDGESAHVARYRRAVYHLTHADVTEKYRGYDTTKSGGQVAADLAATVDDARRNARWAISDILGIARSTVELI